MQPGGSERRNAEREAPERGIKRLGEIPGHQAQHKEQLQQPVAKQHFGEGICLAAVDAKPGAAGHQRRRQLDTQRGAQRRR
ncbi:hypothetical protein D3C81_2112500 [compost metagenome]